MKFYSSMISVLLAAFAPLIGLIAAIIWERERRRKTEKPPQAEKLLRPPGYSLSLRLDKTVDAVMENVLASCGFSTVAGFCVVTLGVLFSLRAPVPALVLPHGFPVPVSVLASPISHRPPAKLSLAIWT